MKRAISLILAAMLLLCGCRPLETNENGEKKPLFNFGFSTEAEPEPKDGPIVVCLDAGHGFGDVGCSSELLGCYEYEVTIDVVKRMEQSLLDLGAQVILTHDGKSYPPEAELISRLQELEIDYKPEAIVENDIFSAYERAMYEEILVRENKIDFFISIHVNSVEHADYVDGYELYYCNGNPNKASLKSFGNSLAKVLDNDLKTVGYDYDDAYIVTKYTTIPSVLFEIGYASNAEDAKKMNNSEWKNGLADLLAREILAYFE